MFWTNCDQPKLPGYIWNADLIIHGMGYGFVACMKWEDQLMTPTFLCRQPLTTFALLCLPKCWRAQGTKVYWFSGASKRDERRRFIYNLMAYICCKFNYPLQLCYGHIWECFVCLIMSSLHRYAGYAKCASSTGHEEHLMLWHVSETNSLFKGLKGLSSLVNNSNESACLAYAAWYITFSFVQE